MHHPTRPAQHGAGVTGIGTDESVVHAKHHDAAERRRRKETERRSGGDRGQWCQMGWCCERQE
jgi:hypothetical protein